MWFSLSLLKISYVHRIEKHVLKFIVIYDDARFFFLKKILLIHFQKKNNGTSKTVHDVLMTKI
jgi:hypothetical protein